MEDRWEQFATERADLTGAIERDTLGDIAEAASSVTEGRSDSFVLLVCALAFVAFVMWRDWKERDAAAVNANARHDIERKERSETNKRFADSLDIVAKSTQEIEKTTKIMSSGIERMEERQEQDRRAIISVIDAVDARERGEKEVATRSISDARAVLLRSSE